ncbi:MAG: hypothetical protein NC453_18490 [Muribaculum sp.]|nr:hypothetical protein [Muribaculum sp.]
MFTLYSNNSFPFLKFSLDGETSKITPCENDKKRDWSAFLFDCHLDAKFVCAKISTEPIDAIIDIPDFQKGNTYEEKSMFEGLCHPLVAVKIPSISINVRMDNHFPDEERRLLRRLRWLNDDSDVRQYTQFNTGGFTFDLPIDEDELNQADTSSNENVDAEKLEDAFLNDLNNLCIYQGYEQESTNTKALILAQTMTADYHRAKGYLSKDENSTLFGREALKLYGLENDILLSNKGDAIIAIDNDLLAIVTSQTEGETQIIDSQYLYAPTPPYHNPCENDITRRAHDNNLRIFKDTELKKCRTRDILVFKRESNIRRGRNDLDINSLYSVAKHSNKSEGLVSFQGIYKFDREDEFGRFIIRRINNKLDI